MHGAALPLCLVVAKPVLEEWGVEGCGAERVEAVVFAGVDDGELAGEGEDGALGGGVGELGSSGADESNDRGRVDDRTGGLLVAPEGEDSVLAPEPDALDVDVVGEIPDLFWSINRIGILNSSVSSRLSSLPFPASSRLLACPSRVSRA